MIYKCFRCERTLVPSLADDEPAPYCGVLFGAHGNYGSGVFDPVTPSGPTLLISICDECLLLHRNLVTAQEELQRTEYSYRPWKPGDWEGPWSQETLDNVLREIRQRLARIARQ